MILTYVIRHDRDFSLELAKAREIAEYAIQYRSLSSKDVKHIGLKSMIANQILRKYARNRKCKKISSVNLVVPFQGIKVDQAKRKIVVPCLKLEFEYRFPNTFSKINQIEVSKTSIHISVTVHEAVEYVPLSFVGVDRNATGHCVVAANETTGKTLKLGKKAKHVRNKYMHMRKALQKKDCRSRLKKIRKRESNIVRDLNHRMSKKVVQFAKDNNAGIVLEDLKGIRKTKRQRKSFKYVLHSWSFYQFQ